MKDALAASRNSKTNSMPMLTEINRRLTSAISMKTTLMLGKILVSSHCRNQSFLIAKDRWTISFLHCLLCITSSDHYRWEMSNSTQMTIPNPADFNKINGCKIWCRIYRESNGACNLLNQAFFSKPICSTENFLCRMGKMFASNVAFIFAKKVKLIVLNASLNVRFATSYAAINPVASAGPALKSKSWPMNAWVMQVSSSSRNNGGICSHRWCKIYQWMSVLEHVLTVKRKLNSWIRTMTNRSFVKSAKNSLIQPELFGSYRPNSDERILLSLQIMRNNKRIKIIGFDKNWIKLTILTILEKLKN